MKSSSLESKTVRPGLGMYSFYHSDRHAQHTAQTVAPPAKPAYRSYKKLLIVVVLVAMLGIFGLSRSRNMPTQQGSAASSSNSSSPLSRASNKTAPSVIPSKNHCASNNLSKLISISVTERHLWACEGSKTKYDSPVITGMEKYAATLTPTGTYHIYAKLQNTVLTGSDQTGSWKDPVTYWMPFLDNENGTYGFHDATWRSNNEFGTVDPYSDKASHGCIELPLATSAWLYNWSEVGTTLIIKT